MPEDDVLLRIEGLKTYFHTYEGVVKSLEGIDIDVRKGETMGLVGETGCGKSVTALTVMGLVQSPPGKVEAGHVFLGEPASVTALRREYDSRFGSDSKARQKELETLRNKLEKLEADSHKDERAEIRNRIAAVDYSYDLLKKTKEELNEIRGNRMSMVFQEPMTALNPAYTIGDQIGETLELHQKEMLVEDVLRQLDLEAKAFAARKRARRIMEKVKDSSAGSGTARKGQMREVCSLCRTPTRDDWGACTNCGARYSGVVPGPIRPMFLKIASSYYRRMREDQYNTWAYLVNTNPVSKRMERRLRLAKTIRAEEALKEVKIAEPNRVARSYPFELSGGMKQRAMIAMMMSCRPDLLIADEPTTALDVTVEAQILSLMKELQRTRGTSILLITHDLGVIAETCHRVAVMYAGYIAELSTARDIFDRPMHPYTNALLRSIPKIGPTRMSERKKPLYVIPGVVPNLLKPPSGCRFHPRCDRSLDVCRSEVPPLRELAPGHLVACHNPVPVGVGQ